MANNPTVIAATLDDSKLRKSISDLVTFVDNQTKKMGQSFDSSMSTMKQSLGEFPTTAQRVKQASKEIADSFDMVSAAIKRAKTSGLGSYPLADKGIFSAEKQAIDEFNQHFQQGVRKAEQERKRLDEIIAKGRESAEQSMRPRERWDVRQDSEINRLRMTIHGLELDLKRLDEINLSRQDAEWMRIKKQINEATRKIIEYEQQQQKLRQQPTANQFEQNAITQQFDLLTQKIKGTRAQIEQLTKERRAALEKDFVGAERDSLTQKLQAAKNEVKQLGQAMIDAENAEKGIATTGQQVAAIQGRITDDIRKQAQAIRESEKFQKTGMFSVKSGVDGSNKEYFVYQKSKQSIEEQLVWIKQEEIKLEEQLHGATKKTAQQLQEEAYAADRARLSAQQMQQSLQAANEAQRSGSKPTRFQDFADLQAAIDHVNSASKKRVQIVNEETAAYYKMQPALRYMQEAYNRLSLEQRNSDMGKNLADQIQRTQRAMQQLQAQMSRPVSLKAAMGLDENTLDSIAYKMRQLSSYRSGLDVNKQAGEIKQVTNEIDRLRKKQEELIGTNNRLANSNNALSRSWNYMKNRLAFYFTVGASTQFVKNLIDVRSQYEMTERSLGILINSAERGTQIFNQLSDMALVSPYTLIELSNAAKQLVAYDVAAKDVVDTTRRLADMAAAVGIPMERLTYALGQIKAYGYLNSRDARMFANAGIPLVKQLSEYYTQLEGRMVSIGDVYSRMKKKTIEYNDVMSVINKMTDEGGKFFDFQAKMAGTLKVQLANLTLAWNNMLNSIGSSNQGILVGGIKMLKEFFLQWKNIERALSSLAIGFTIFKTLQLAALALAKNVTAIRTGLVGMNVNLSYSGVLGSKLTNIFKGVGGALKGLFTAQNGIFLVIFAIVDMVMKINQAKEAIIELNNSIRDGAKETKKSLDELLSSYSQLGAYTLTTDQKTGRVASATYTGSKDPDEMQKTWTAIREEIETSTAYGKVFMGQLATETDLSKRLSKAFEITSKLRDVRGALEDIDESAIKVQQDMSAWWNLYEMDKGLINSLKEIAKHNYENTAFEILRKDDVSKYNDIFQDIKDAADETAKSISDTFSNLKFDPQQMREGFEEISNKIFEGKGLDPKTELQGRIELEKAFIRQRKQMYIDAANEQAQIGNQAQAEQILASYNTWIKGFQQNQVLVNGFYDWLKSHHASELQSMFGNMTQDEINHINWSEPRWQEWARKNALAFSQQMGTSFNDLWNWVKLASTWQVRIGVVLDTTQVQKSVFETLSTADTKANDSYQRIQRLTAEIDRLQKKANRTAEENNKLTKAINERTVAQNDYNKAVAEGGKSSKEEAASRKAENAANKRAAAARRSAAKAQKQAESELQKAFKDELQLIDKVRSQYKKLTDAGVTHTVALTMVTNQFGNSISNINKILGKNGLPLFDISTFSGTEDPNKLLELLNKQLRAAKAAKNVKPVEIKDLEIKIGEVTVDAKTYNMKKVTDGLNNELSKIKDEYELAVELDANPELGNFLENMFDFDTTAFPKSIDEYMWNVQDAFEKAVDDMGLDEKGKFFDVFTASEDDWKQWAESVGMSEEALKDFSAKFIESKGVAKKWARDIIKQTQDLEYKLSDTNGKIAIEEEKLANLRKQLANEVNEEQQHLLELQIQDQENTIARLKDEAVSTLSTYKNLFNSIVEHSARVTRMLAQQWKGALENAVKNADNTYTITDPNSGETSTVSKEKYNKLLNQVNAKLRDTQTSFDKIKEALTKGEDELVDWVKDVELISDEVHKISDGIGEIVNIADALGADEDVTEVINDIAASVDGLATAAQGAAQIANGDIIGGTVNVMKGLWSTVSSWFDNSDKKITKKVEKSEREVKRLENAYKNLEYAVEHSMGTAETQARRAAIANKQLQLVELERQLTLEKSRKKKNQDQDKIQELEGAVIDAKNELKDLKDEVMNTLLGSDIKSAAEEFVDTWVQAWKEGETTLDAINEKMDDMIFNLIKKAATSKIVGTMLKPLYDAVDYYSSSASEGGVEFTTNEMKALADLSKQLGVDINTALGAFYGNLENLDVISKDIKSSELSALQQGIQGITEDTAGALEAITNGISQQVYLHSDLLTQIRDAVVALDGDVQMSVQGQMLLQLQQSYQVQMAIQTIMVGWSNPSGSAVKVELLN